MRTIRGTKANDALTAPYVLISNPLFPPDGYEMFGEDGDDTITGSNVADILHGGKGRDALNGGSGNDTLEGGADADVLDGGTGIDTASYEFSDAGVTVSLRSGTGRGGHAEGDTLRNIENLLGSRYADNLSGDKGANVLMGGDGNDRLFGDDGNDTLEGGAGKDSLDGGNGTDTARYTDSGAGVTVNLATGRGQGGSAEGDKLTNIENVTGSSFDDVLIGDAGNNVLDGGAGNDVLEGGLGQDMLDGGAGVDTASYAASTRGVYVTLGGGFALDDVNGDGEFNDLDDVNGDGQLWTEEITDTLASIENLTGSAYDDELYGNADANTLRGGGGADRLYGADGDDVLEGGAGHDEIIGGNGQDTISYAKSNAGVGVFLVLGQGFGGHAQGDTWESVENIEGSAFGDVLVGDWGDNVIQGGDGDDVIRGGGGVDEIWGGAGNDTFWFDSTDASNWFLDWNIEGIVDFTAGGDEDVIDLTDADTGYTSLADVLANSEVITGSTGQSGLLIDLGPSGAVVLVGVAPSDLTANDFIFA